MGEHYGPGIMEPLAVTVVKIDASFAFAVDCEFQGSCVRTGADEGSDGLAFEFKTDGLARGFAVEQRPAQVSCPFSARKVFPFGLGKFPSVAWGGFGRGKEPAVEVTVRINGLEGELFLL